MKIVGISRVDNGYKLKLKDYAESLYTIGAIPDYVSNATKRNNNSVANNPDYQQTPQVQFVEKKATRATKAIQEKTVKIIAIH